MSSAKDRAGSGWSTALKYLGLGPADKYLPVKFRVGQGFDVHRFSDDPARTMVLGGVRFPDVAGLEGHSDADAIAHSCADALLGAAGLGDIGMHFPDTDERWRDADSITMLRHVVALVSDDGWSISNIDTAVVCEQPKLAPHRDEMQRVLSDAVGAPVTVKGNRAERLGAIGRGEGVACFATALLQRDRQAAWRRTPRSEKAKRAKKESGT